MLTNAELKLIDMLVSWQVVGLLVLASIIVFRKGLGAFFEKRDIILRAKDYGVSSAPATEGNKEAQQKQKRRSKPRKPTINKAVIKEYEDQLATKNQNLTSTRDQLAQTEAALDFEQIYNAIYGSQLRLLNLMNTNPAATYTPLDLQLYLGQHQQALGASAFQDMNSFLWFLLAKGLIQQHGGTYQITEKGQAFMSYIASQKYNLYKQG